MKEKTQAVLLNQFGAFAHVETDAKNGEIVEYCYHIEEDIFGRKVTWNVKFAKVSRNKKYLNDDSLMMRETDYAKLDHEDGGYKCFLIIEKDEYDQDEDEEDEDEGEY